MELDRLKCHQDEYASMLTATIMKPLKIIKNIFLKIAGGGLVIFGLFMLVVGIGISIEGEQNNGPSIAIASIIFFIPGAAFIYLALLSERNMERLETVISAVKSYRRIKLIDLASKTGFSVPEVGRHLMKGISLGIIRGHFDRTTDEFFTEEAIPRNDIHSFCAQCGAPVEGVFLEGESVQCHMCGTMMKQ